MLNPPAWGGGAIETAKRIQIEEYAHGPEPTPRQLADIAKALQRCERGMTEEDFGQALSNSGYQFGGVINGGGPFKRYREGSSVGKLWRLNEVFDRSKQPAVLVSANLYTVRTLTEAEAERIHDAVKAHPYVSSLAEFWGRMGPVLEGLSWHTQAIDAEPFYSRSYQVGDHSISLTQNNLNLWIDVSFR